MLVRPIIVARAVAEYAGLIAFPLNLHMDRDVETQPSGLNEATVARAAWRELQTLLGIVLIAAFFYWLFRARKRNPAICTCLLLVLVTYLPVSGIVALNATAAEHWIYLPTAFLFLAIGVELALMAERSHARTLTITLASGLLALWVAFLGGRTFARTFDWKDQRTFLERTIAHGGDSARMLINLASLELNEGKFLDAAAHLHTALQKKPDQPLAIINLAAVALKQNDFKHARELLNRATQLPIVDAQAHQLLAVLEHKENGTIDLMRMRLASRTGPPNWAIEKAYIQLLDQTGVTGTAINELLACLQTQWYRADSWQLLSELEAKAGHPDQAANALAQAQAYDVHFRNSETGTTSITDATTTTGVTKQTQTEGATSQTASPGVSASASPSTSASPSASASASASATASADARTTASPKSATSARAKGGTSPVSSRDKSDEMMRETIGESSPESTGSPSGKKSTHKATSKEPSPEGVTSPSAKKSSHKKGNSEGTSETDPTPGGEQE